MSSLRWKRMERWCFEMSIVRLHREIKDYLVNNEVSSLKFLKILDSTDYLAENTRVKWIKYFLYMLIIGTLMNHFLEFDKNISSEYINIFINALLLFVITVLVILGYNFLILFISHLFKDIYHSYLKKRLKVRRLFSALSFVKYFWIKLLILMPMNAFIISYVAAYIIPENKNLKKIENFINLLFKEYDLNYEFNGKVWSFWLICLVVLIASCLSFYIVLKSQNIFELEGMELENRLILGVLAIVTFIVGVDIDKVRPIGIALLVLIIQTAFFEFRQSQFLSKMYQKAQQIFQEQVLKNEDSIDYNRLVECYYYGGEKYKEKLLSTEKFLVIIVKNELKSLKDLKTYDNYRLYKAIRARNI